MALREFALKKLDQIVSVGPFCLQGSLNSPIVSMWIPTLLIYSIITTRNLHEADNIT